MKQLMGLALALAAAVALAACGGTQTPATAKKPTCDDVAANAEKQFLAIGDQSDEARQMAAIGRQVVLDRCPADHWSDEALACMIAATSHDQLRQCAETKLTDAQHTSMEQEIQAKMPQEELRKAAPTTGAPAPGGGAAGTAAPDDPCSGGD
ncbi:MAG TPA: hypothetical protein VHE35_10630 [Kofleriaceae bacterium]|nr:hypothetical protein [Kofleriaceae bacterium]